MNPCLLFVDDIPEDAEIACWQLRQARIDVDYVVVDTEQKLTAALTERMPDLILSDIVLPAFDAWSALRTCKEVAPGVPFVLYSGAISIEHVRLAQIRGVLGKADKDVPAELVSIVRRALGLP